MAIQPVLAFGQITADTTEPPAPSGNMALMDCYSADLARAEGHPERDVACGDMTSSDCVVAVNQGTCGTAPCVLVSEKGFVRVQSPSNVSRLRPHEGYLSIILDTLTPPPNSSKA